MNFFKRNTFFSIVFLCSFYVYPMKRTYTVPNPEHNASQQDNSEEKKIYNILEIFFNGWLNTAHPPDIDSLTKKDQDKILEQAQKKRISLDEAIAIFLREKRNNQSHPLCSSYN